MVLLIPEHRALYVDINHLAEFVLQETIMVADDKVRRKCGLNRPIPIINDQIKETWFILMNLQTFVKKMKQ